MLTKLVKNIDRQLAVGSSRLESSTQLARLSWPPRIAFCAACPLASNLRLFWVAYSHALLEVVQRSLSSESPRRSIAADPLDSVAPDPRSIAADPLGPVTLDLLGSVAPDGLLALDALAGTDTTSNFCLFSAAYWARRSLSCVCV